MSQTLRSQQSQSQQQRSSGASQSQQSQSTRNRREAQDLSVYSNFHRLIFQSFLGTGLLGVKEIRTMFKATRQFCNMPAVSEDDELSDAPIVIRCINDRLSRYNIAVRNAIDEISGKRYYVMGFLSENPMSKFQSNFSKPELELFEKVVGLIFTTGDEFNVNLIDCVNESRSLKAGKISLADAEKFLNHLVKQSYLIENGGDGNVTLGIRAIKELEIYLTETYPNSLAKCQLCKSYMLHGLKCRSCSTYVHGYCFKKFTKTCKQCIQCKSNCWSSKEEMLTRKREDMVEPVPDPHSDSNTSNEDMSEGDDD